MLDPRDDEIRGVLDDLTDRSAAWAGGAGVAMSAVARTPEELETLLEDALVMRDREALADLFDDDSVLKTKSLGSARGSGEIAQLALAAWQGDDAYVADLRSVSQAFDIALVVAERSINVARRGRDGAWRYAIVLQAIDEGVGRRTQ
ncbi:MAG: hypothetical protein M3457_18845 [Chloroflexota bacterium]|nr:hypothetical protein [Chloroflexota bacterium]